MKDLRNKVKLGTASGKEYSSVKRQNEGQENGRTVLTLLTLQSLTLLSHSYIR